MKLYSLYSLFLRYMTFSKTIYIDKLVNILNHVDYIISHQYSLLMNLDQLPMREHSFSISLITFLVRHQTLLRIEEQPI